MIQNVGYVKIISDITYHIGKLAKSRIGSTDGLGGAVTLTTIIITAIKFVLVSRRRLRFEQISDHRCHYFERGEEHGRIQNSIASVSEHFPHWIDPGDIAGYQSFRLGGFEQLPEHRRWPRPPPSIHPPLKLFSDPQS
jgi:hypothetical protein